MNISSCYSLELQYGDWSEKLKLVDLVKLFRCKLKGEVEVDLRFKIYFFMKLILIVT